MSEEKSQEKSEKKPIVYEFTRRSFIKYSASRILVGFLLGSSIGSVFTYYSDKIGLKTTNVVPHVRLANVIYSESDPQASSVILFYGDLNRYSSSDEIIEGQGTGVWSDLAFGQKFDFVRLSSASRALEGLSILLDDVRLGEADFYVSKVSYVFPTDPKDAIERVYGSGILKKGIKQGGIIETGETYTVSSK